MTKKLSVLKPRRLRNLYFISFSYHNVEDIVTKFKKDMFRKESLTNKQKFKRSVFSDFSSCFKVCSENKLKVSLFVFNYQTVFSFCVVLYLRKIVRN